MAGRRLTGRRLIDEGQVGRHFVDPANVPFNQLPPLGEIYGQEEQFYGQEDLPYGPEFQPLPEIEQPRGERMFRGMVEGQLYQTNRPEVAARLGLEEVELPPAQYVGEGEDRVSIYRGEGAPPLEAGQLPEAVSLARGDVGPEVGVRKGTALEQAQELYEQMLAEGVVSEYRLALKELGLDEAIKIEERLAKAKPKAEGVSEVQSSKILPGGLGAEIVRKDGTIELVTLKEAESELIKAVEKSDAELQGLRAGERGAAKLAIAKSKEAFEKMTLIQENIATMGDAIAELDAGAETGFIQSKLPSIRASSIKLENIQKQLGLNVIGGVTFGALSKGELDLALSKALPTGLDETDLRIWLVDKKEAQEKLIDNLQEAAIYLGTPGNTVAKFLKSNKEQAKETKLPSGVTEEDIVVTMRENNMTRQQVLDRLGGI